MSPDLTPDELKAAKAAGMTPEEYEAFKSPQPDHVDVPAVDVQIESAKREAAILTAQLGGPEKVRELRAACTEVQSLRALASLPGLARRERAS